MAKIKVVTPENLGDNFIKEQGKIKVNIDNQSIVEDENGVLKVNPYANTRVFSFASPSLEWNITHDLSRRPSSILLFNSNNKQMSADVDFISDTEVKVSFGEMSPMAGYCILSI